MEAKEKTYVQKFEELGFGLFVHFGLYSIVGKGEWYLYSHPSANKSKYEKLIDKFKIKKNWAKELVKTAKSAGCKYITLTTRHHDGFSLYDTCGLSRYDSVHSASKRDLVREFVDECNKNDIVPFFYHTLLDWNQESYNNDFVQYLDYLIASVEILCKNYGKIGGFWFDGKWDKIDADWQEDRLYSTIRRYQPQAMIINNSGLNELGKVGHTEIDSVTFERGKPCFVDCSDKYRAGEMCQVLNDHWGYAKNDVNYKSMRELIENLIDCRACNCNFLLNTGLLGNGGVNAMDSAFLREIGKWIKANKDFIYTLKSTDIKAENAVILKDENYYYAIIKDVPMSSDPNVQRVNNKGQVFVNCNVVNAIWLDSGEKIEVVDNHQFEVKPFTCGTSFSVRVARFNKCED